MIKIMMKIYEIGIINSFIDYNYEYSCQPGNIDVCE